MSNQPVKNREPLTLFKWLVTIILVALCLWAAQWQFQRGIDRQDRNDTIEAQLTLPVLNISEIPAKDNSQFEKFEWRTVKASGWLEPNPARYDLPPRSTDIVERSTRMFTTGLSWANHSSNASIKKRPYDFESPVKLSCVTSGNKKSS
jgi:hypothetical protein